jgi:hypothetical protein
MKKLTRLLAFGFLSWLFTFAGAMALSGIRENYRPLFESLMGPVLVTSTVLFTLLYFRRVQSGHLREAGLLSIAFVACNILLDLPMFMEGPMKMRFSAYLTDIGLAYLSMPMVAFAVAWQAQSMGRVEKSHPNVSSV